MRLRRVSPNDIGWRRRRAGRGWVYLDADGVRLAAADAGRCQALVIPPAWQQVWICPWPNGHIQAVGIDAAGRRQYLYHEQWRLQRDADKFDRLLVVSRRLPTAREQVLVHLGLPGMPRERALATAFRMLDLGYFRVGGESYAEANGSFGLATILKSHVRMLHGALMFEFLAKSGQQQQILLTDPYLLDSLTVMRRRRGGTPELLAYREGRQWRDITTADINAYVKAVIRSEVSAKDFRTWHGTVLAAIALATSPISPTTQAKRKRAVAQAMREVAEYLGNTPAVARKAYVDPRVIDLYEDGTTIERALRRLGPSPDLTVPENYAVAERAVGKLLRQSPKSTNRSSRS
jgi:DNA topoisomerase IB